MKPELVTMKRKAYLSEHAKLTKLLDKTSKALSKESKSQKEEVKNAKKKWKAEKL
jgi:hypothetical protein